MASEVRVNQIQNRSGLGTITVADSGVVISGITTISDLRTSGTTVVAAGTTSAPSISPSGDSNTGIFFPSADTVAIAEGGTEVLRVDSNGRLGIGSATPGFQVTVDQGTTDGNLVDIKNEEVRLLTGVWGTGATYPREITLNATRFDSGTVPALRLAGQGGIKFAVDLNTVRMEIDSSGRVLMPYQPYARASSTSLVSSGNAIPLNSYNLSRGGITISGNRFTVPVAGAYVFGYHHLGNSGSGACQVEIRHNGTYVSGTRTQDTNSSNDSFGTQTVKELAASDYIEFWVIQGTTHNNTDYNSMWIWLIG